MNFGLVITGLGDNLGDDMQSFAASQYLPRVDSLIIRERISKAKVAPGTRVIMSGWYMHNTRFWPPHRDIVPLYVSFHARPPRSRRFAETFCDNVLGLGSSNGCVDPSFKGHYDTFGPIGCRDEATSRAFKAIGVDAFFSGCLTLTIPRKEIPRSDTIVFVDPFGPFPHNCFNPMLWMSLPRELRHHSERFTHLYLGRNIEKRMDRVESALRLYEQSGLVITSRLHVALPCVALKTPFIFISNNHRCYRLEGFERVIQPVSIPRFLEGARRGREGLLQMVSRVDEGFVGSLQDDLRARCHAFVGAQ
jgi:hypothetical protein